ncbi:MAG: polyprenyl diphosphate synthase [Limnobacter sp.]|nr:polyprenyl diphosphate synthase [Limnobacter sp.]
MTSFTSSTLVIPETHRVPLHIAIVMDGNGRWAKQRLLPRFAGHRKGVEAVRRTVQACVEAGVKHLTLFAFSSENWRRPADEVSLLMRMFIRVLQKDVKRLKAENIRLRVIGDISAFNPELQQLIHTAERETADNTLMSLNIAANYGGRWDILQATRQMLLNRPELGTHPDQIKEEDLTPYLSLFGAPEPDLFIRTGGEQRISNFLLWQLAYTELYFTERYWPDFGRELLAQAIESYNQRERRFGRTSEQLKK